MKKLSLLIILLLVIGAISVFATEGDYVADEVDPYDYCVAKQDGNSIYTPGYSLCYDAYELNHIVFDTCKGDSLREVALLESELPFTPADGSMLFYVEEPYTIEDDSYPYQDYFYTYYVDVPCVNGCEEIDYEFEGVTYGIGACLPAEMDMPEIAHVPECQNGLDDDGDGMRDYDNGNGGWCDSDGDGSLWDEDIETKSQNKCQCLQRPWCNLITPFNGIGRFLGISGKQTTMILPTPSWIDADPQCSSPSHDSESSFAIALRGEVDEYETPKIEPKEGFAARLFNIFQQRSQELQNEKSEFAISDICTDSDFSSSNQAETPGTLTCGKEVFHDGCLQTSSGDIYVTEYTSSKVVCENGFRNCEEGRITSDGVEYVYYWGFVSCESGYQCAGDNTEEFPGYCMKRRTASVNL